MDVSNERRIVILGKTGSGKSSLANTIFGEKLFKISHNPNSETRECEAETRSVNGRSITLIDTPGFFDTDRSEEDLKEEIVRCITECAPGPHAFLIVLKVEKFTKHEQDVINKIHEYFTEEAFKYATVVFTHGEQLSEGQKIEDFVSKNRLISDLVKKCGGRCHAIDNRYWNKNTTHEYRSNQRQVEELLKSLDEMATANNRSYYTNEMLQKVEDEIQQEEETIRLLPGKLSQKEIREKAKASVFEKLVIRLAGIATGALLGALLGVLVSVGLVMAVAEHAPMLAKIVGVKYGAAIGASAVGLGAGLGAVIGGVQGYHAAEGADTPLEAAKRAAEGIENKVIALGIKTKDTVDRMKQAKKNCYL